MRGQNICSTCRTCTNLLSVTTASNVCEWCEVISPVSNIFLLFDYRYICIIQSLPAEMSNMILKKALILCWLSEIRNTHMNTSKSKALFMKAGELACINLKSVFYEWMVICEKKFLFRQGEITSERVNLTIVLINFFLSCFDSFFIYKRRIQKKVNYSLQ